MAGPWEQYQQAPDAPGGKPWERYAAKSTPAPVSAPPDSGAEPEAPPGPPFDPSAPAARKIVPEAPSPVVASRAPFLPIVTQLGQKRQLERGEPQVRAGVPGVIAGIPGAVRGTVDLMRKGGEVALGRRPVEDVSPREALEMASLGVGAAPVGRAVGRGVGAVAEGVLPKTAKRTVEELRGEGLSQAKGAVATEETAARKAEAEAKSWLEIEQNRQRVLSDLREKARVLQKSHQEAGENVVQAQGHVAVTERKLRDVGAAVEQLEQGLLARPQMTAEEFGQRIRKTTQEIHDKYSQIRKDESGFDRALDSAGDTPRVSTIKPDAMIAHYLQDIRNPNLQRVLTGLKDQLQSDMPHPRIPGQTIKIPRLSVRAAESARGYLDSIIRSKQFGDLKLDKETVFIIRQIKKSLVESATQAWQPYRQALAKWRTLSRPLDIVERKGALRKVIDTDPVSTDYALTDAQVVGRVLTGAKAGNPTLTRLIKENPELRDAARLHFTQDLFVRETVPSEAMLRTWLKNNERALKQTGLYNEFRDIRVARETANKAVNQAKGMVTESKAEMRAAQEAERGAAERLATAERLRQKQLKRIADAQQAAKDQAGRAEGTTVLSRRRIPESAESKRSVATQRRDAAAGYRKRAVELQTAPMADVPSQTRSLFSDMAKSGHLSEKQYSELLNRVNQAEAKIKDRAKLVARLRVIAKSAILAGATGYGAYYGAKGLSSLIP